jgi:transglutaminase-like putative cysteine protease
VGFADVKNHLATRQLLDYMGSDLFVFHGYVEFYLEGRWVKATPAFNAELCARHDVAPLAFNGTEDSIFHAYNREKQQFMEYVADHGVYADIPVDEILAAWRKTYGRQRVASWIEGFESRGQNGGRDFYREEVIH